jgi:hypothetical protein
MSTSTFIPVDIGIAPNDGSGDNIRDAFDKINTNFSAIYALISGTTSTARPKFIDLADTPKNYTTGTSKVGNGPIVTGVNNAGTLMVNRLLTGANGIVIDPPTDGLITIRAVTTGLNLTSVASSIIPSSDITFDLGSLTNQWRSLYVGTSTIYIGGNELSISPAGVLLVNNSEVGLANVEGGAASTVYQSVFDVDGGAASDL